MVNGSQPIPLAKRQLSDARALMGRAFVDDPLLRFLAPDAAKRQQLTPEFTAIVVDYCHYYGEAWTLPGLEGLACWLLMPLKFGWQGFQRFGDMVSYTEALHKQFAPMPHWYLWGLGVDPIHQRKGLGGALLQPVFARADAAKQMCYLETQNALNLPFYEKHGFEVVSSGTVPKHDLPIWAMTRKPQ
jgi:GNAT superfamily N-acetyltransferase